MTLETFSVTGVILAGGKAMRMGGVNKALQEYQSKPLIDSVTESMLEICQELYINANKDHILFEEKGFSTFSDDQKYPDSGPLIGVYSALQITNTSHLLLSPCDTPSVPSCVFKTLVECARLQPTKIFYIDTPSGAQPLHAIWPVNGMLKLLDERLKKSDFKVMDFYRHVTSEGVCWDAEDVFMNINTDKELKTN